MSTTDMSKRNDTLNSLSSSNKLYYHAVKLDVPYLGTVYSSVPDMLSDLILETTLTIFISRHCCHHRDKNTLFGDIAINEDVNNFISNTDDFEEEHITFFIHAVIDYEEHFNGVILNDNDINIIDNKYRKIIQDIISFYNTYLTLMPDDFNQEQVNYLINHFEVHGKLNISHYIYYQDIGKLYIFILI